ncbi:MAG TPA: FAD:protein FMN transferase [Verrucomicrobiae bacterium]|jgi:thiamine biosynthesis lipoprotein|nr:FAD:protein FMN transferase [Verrucomicrobiae bacterium]
MKRFGFMGLALLAAGCVSTPLGLPPDATPYEFEHAEMGVPFRIFVYAPSKNAAEGAATAAFSRIAQINDEMTDYDSDSELSRLSQTSGQDKEVHVSPDLWRVLERAQDLAERSHGAFDATVGPYVNLWRYARRKGAMPDPVRLAKARMAVGYTKMKLDPRRHTVKLIAPNMRLDLGGIAKGYAVDQALRTLTRLGVTNALIFGGGDMAMSGKPPGRKGWRIELPPLDATNAPMARYVVVSNVGISTSGDLFQRLEINGTRYSHIIDPRTGIGLTDHRLVTVIAGDDFTADGLTKVMSVLPPSEALKFIAKTPGAYVRIVRKPGANVPVEVYQSWGFNRFYE